MTDPDHSHVRAFVFVYGTLRQGEDNDITRLTPPPVLVGRAHVQGTLFHLGDYPGLLLEGTGTVVGDVYEITPPLERVLDQIEGLWPVPNGEYSKGQIRVDVQGQRVECLVYLIRPDLVRGRPIMQSGDWVLETARDR